MLTNFVSRVDLKCSIFQGNVMADDVTDIPIALLNNECQQQVTNKWSIILLVELSTHTPFI